MSLKARWIVGAGLSVVLAIAVLRVVWGSPLRASPGLQEGEIDLETYTLLRAQVDTLREQGRDVSSLETVIADIDRWIAEDKVAEANLRIKDLEQALADFDLLVRPTYLPESDLPPAPVYLPVSQAGDTVLLEEDFAGVDVLNAWQREFLSFDPGNMAVWEQRQNALHLNMGAGGMQIVGMINVVGADWSDYVYSVDVFPEQNLEVGVVFRHHEGDFYRFRFLSYEHREQGTRLLERVTGQDVLVLDQADGPGYQLGQWYNVQVVVEGPQITVYLNGELVVQATDDVLSQGQVGVYALSLGDVYFDNVRVTTLR